MPISNLVETARSIRQSHKSPTERNLAQLIDRDTANTFNKLLNDSKNKCPEHPFIIKMQPVKPGRTQLGGLLSKVNLLEDSLKAEQARFLSSLAEKKTRPLE